MTILSVVIPAYNEEDGITEIATRVLAVAPDLKKAGVEEMELLVVDDGSRDKTAEVASNIKGVTLVRHPKNKGYGAALKTGFAQAKGELIGFLDADGTYPPEYFPKLCQSALRGAELVIGSRMAGEKSEMPLVRRIGNFFFATLLTILGRQKVTDSASGMRVFRREILEHIYPLPDGLNLTPVMSTRALHEGIKIEEVPIPYSERVGRSKLSAIRDGRIFLQSMVWTAMSYNPVRILGLIGLGSLGVAGLVSLWLVYLRARGVTTLDSASVAALFLGMISTVAGINVFALGITFNYLVALFYKKPIKQGLFGKPIFKTPLDQQFGWMGLLGILAGFALGAISLALGLQGWAIERLWFYLLGSAMIFLVGIQLVVYWMLLRILEELSQRESLTKQDMGM
ncbi:MAG: glycosyltransferase family 2 protein [Anaerolineae bacterium]|jgi:glycosyltransferase involved in cell wall biosynthesis|nr:glycosyltransferase family 2 protein [Anaerolineae bacterium]MBL8105402.1 glycosyltransferase family 2 protein [Anaerolineales bacterium]MCC7190055.1 glycosyltransferase family 2 protein [Anaerolineales bacterium]